MITKLLSKFYLWFSTPQTSDRINKNNFINVQLDAVGVGMASAALPFMPVFLARLGANSFQVGLLTTLPALTGFLLSIPLGQYLETRSNLVRWYSLTRAIGLARFALIGLIPFVFPSDQAILVILIIWGIFTLPLTLLQTMFSIVMNQVAGPKGRFELLSRRWSIIGITTAVTVFITGQVLDRIVFPLNYQVVLIIFSLGGVLSYQFSRRLVLPERYPQRVSKGIRLKARLKNYVKLIESNKPFISFASKRFVFILGFTMATPILPLYFVRQIDAPDSWIAIFSTSQTAILFVGYFLWLRIARTRGSRFILVTTTFCLSFYPMVIAISRSYWLIAFFAGIEGLFEAGLNLVFFDELMKTVPEEYAESFVSMAQSIQYLASVIAPAIATTLSDQIGLSWTLFVSGTVQLSGFLLFSLKKPHSTIQQSE